MTKSLPVRTLVLLLVVFPMVAACTNGEHEGEESGRRLTKSQAWDEERRGAHLTLAWDEPSESFRGVVRNVSEESLAQVRVEVHLSNGVELGPTKRVDLGPGESTPVELSAAGQEFEWWTTHPKHGTEEGHGPGHEEGGGSGEHGREGGDSGEHR